MDNNRKVKLEMLTTSLIPWFQKNGRPLPWRSDIEPYHVWLSEIMLQQTRIETVKPYYERFLEEIPDISTLADADLNTLYKLWEGLGYYSRVRNLQAAAKQIMTDYCGKFPDTLMEIKKLKGIGDYTAGAIGSICFNLPTPAVDGNVLRVISRITGDTRPVDEVPLQKTVTEELSAIYPRENCGIITQSLMELGETVCIPNGKPGCPECPCSSFCYSADGAWSFLPVRNPKKQRKKEKYTVFLLMTCDGQLAVRKRGNDGILADMWEFPSISGIVPEQSAIDQATDWNCSPVRLIHSFQDKHIFTHIEWLMNCNVILCENQSDDFIWLPFIQIDESIALPTAFKKLLKHLGDEPGIASYENPPFPYNIS